MTPRRDILQQMVDAFGLDDLSGFTPEQAKAIHDARNALAVPDHFNRDICKRILSRLDAQHHDTGVKRDRAALELLMGAAMCMEVNGDPRLEHFLIICTLASCRGAAQLVRKVANDEGI